MVDEHALEVMCTCGEPLGYQIIDGVVTVEECEECRKRAYKHGWDDSIEVRAEHYAGLDDLQNV